MSNIEQFPRLTPDDLLEELKGKYEKLLVIGKTKDGAVEYSANMTSIPEIVYFAECLKFDMLSSEVDYE